MVFTEAGFRVGVLFSAVGVNKSGIFGDGFAIVSNGLDCGVGVIENDGDF